MSKPVDTGSKATEWREQGNYLCALGHKFTMPTTERQADCPRCKCCANLQFVDDVREVSR